MPTAYAYCRVSTESQALSGMGLEAQKEITRKYFDYRFAPIGVEWGDWWVDPAVSGSKPFSSRPAGGALAGRMERGDHLIVAKMDRIFRKFLDFAKMTHVWEERGVSIHLLDINVDTSSPVGKLIMRVMASVAEFERTRISERCRDAYAQRKAAGRAILGSASYGWRYQGKPGKRVKVKEPYEWNLLQKLMDFKAKGFSYYAIYRWLVDNKIPSRYGARWSMSQVQRAITYELRRRTNESVEQRGKGTNGHSRGTAPAGAEKAVDGLGAALCPTPGDGAHVGTNTPAFPETEPS